uniref:DSH domain protein n=1 Tax=Cyanothece sp. (strain PCC 7425 / ATCC 29141) TaxID=395961 RepID=B8HTI1_CYAP4
MTPLPLVATLNLPNFSTLFPFPLDTFQQEAIAALEADQSVVVCAPTGSGKTLIGEYAIYRALSRQRRVFYTTPLKALSNQKLRDFRQQFGAEQVGLLTGDVSINRDAPILVMTTEIFRNMLYGTPIGEVGTSLAGVEVVVLDECHYMNDRQRGTVWEESIIYCPAAIQLVALSATIANSQQLTDWIDQVHGPTRLIYSEQRPVPLRYHFCTSKGLFPLLNRERTKLNAQLSQQRGRQGRQSHRSEDIPNLTFVLSQLKERDMLPAIYFIFSRRGCDQAIAEVSSIQLLNPAETLQLQIQIDHFLQQHPDQAASPYVKPLYQGIAAHHAGILPLWKGLVEELFQQGLIKVVFATETLAAGINMPARTTVISSLSKRTDSGHRLLTPSEFLQMAGRAGRRGMDQLGHVVTQQTPFEGGREAAYLATAGADPLISQFSPSYGMVLNLLQTHTLEQAKELVERSFGQYLSTLHLAPQRQAIADLTAEFNQVQAKLATVDLNALKQYQKLREQVREEERLLKILQHQAEETRRKQLALAIVYAPPGTLLSLKPAVGSPRTCLSAVVVSQVASSGQFPYLGCLGQDNHWYVVSLDQVVDIHAALPLSRFAALPFPAELPHKPGSRQAGTAETTAIAAQIPDCEVEVPAEVLAQQGRLEAIQAKLTSHPLHLANPALLQRLQQRATRLQDQIRSRQEKLNQQSHHHWEEFLCLLKILQTFRALEDLAPTPLGQTAAALRGDNELWLGLAIASGELDGLDPHHFAAACAALVTETPRSDSYTSYEPADAVDAALMALRPLRRQLFQAQRRYQVVLPVWLEPELVGLVEQWALGTEWSELCTHTNLDEGDIVRLLRRTLDFLSQLPHAPQISPELRQNALRAHQLLDRFPVNDILQVS